MSDDSRRHPTRRELLQGGVLAAGGALLARPAAALAPPAPAAGERPVLVVVNLDGGNDGLNTVVPLTLAGYHDARRTLAIDAEDAVGLDRGPRPTRALGLHPSMTALGALWEEGHLAIVQKVGYPRPDYSHFGSRDVWALGCRDCGDDTPGWIARYKDNHAPGARDVIGLRAGFPLELQGGRRAPMLLDSVTQFSPLRDDTSFPANARYRRAVVEEMLAEGEFSGSRRRVARALASGFLLARDLDDTFGGPRNGAVYPPSPLGSAMRDVAVLLRLDAPMHVVFTESGGFDTHSRQDETHAALLADLDAALGAFARDVRDDHWARVAIVVVSEFGRTTDENGSGGTDHASTNPVLVCGGAVRGGSYGGTLVEADLRGELRHEVDFRQVYWELLDRHLGADPEAVFPEPPASTAPLGFIA